MPKPKRTKPKEAPPPAESKQWTWSFDPKVKKELKGLGSVAAKRIIDFLEETIVKDNAPRGKGSALKGPLREYWRYRVGDYRIFVDIVDAEVTVVVVDVDHRREAYR